MNKDYSPKLEREKEREKEREREREKPERIIPERREREFKPLGFPEPDKEIRKGGGTDEKPKRDDG